MKRISALLLFSLALTGCAHRIPPPAGSLVFPRSCIKAVELKDSTVCRGPDEKHLRCTDLKMSIDRACGALTVQR